MEQGVNVGRTILTGATGTLGRRLTLRLVERGESVVLAVRDVERGWALKQKLREQVPEAIIDVLPLNLASLASVREFGASVLEQFDGWDRLLNVAAVTSVPHREFTDDRFELHFGVNHLGHFAATGLLMPAANAQARVVTVSSLVARQGEIRFHDLRFDHGYRPMRAYAASKLANLLFATELDRRLTEQGARVRSIAAHPGAVQGSASNLFQRAAVNLIGHDADAAADSIMAAAFGTIPPAGSWIGPADRFGAAGAPAASAAPLPKDAARTALRLWRLSGQLTRVHW